MSTPTRAAALAAVVSMLAIGAPVAGAGAQAAPNGPAASAYQWGHGCRGRHHGYPGRHHCRQGYPGGGYGYTLPHH